MERVLVSVALPPHPRSDRWPASGRTRKKIPTTSRSSNPTGPSTPRARCSPARTRSCTRCAALGFQPGDTLAAILPNGRHPMHLYLAALQAGWYYVPINYRLSPPEVAYILQDSEAKAFVSHERFADLASAAAEEAGIPPEGRLAHGTVPGFRSFDEVVDPQPTTMPEDRATGAAMHYTSGTTGKPKGVKRAARGHRSRHERRAVHVPPRHLRHHARRRQRAPLHVAELPHRGHDVRGQLAALEAHRRVHGPLGSGGGAAVDRALPRTHTHMVPTQFIRMLQLPEE